MNQEFVRISALTPKLYLGNPKKNKEEILREIKKLEEKEVQIVVTPELSLTGYTCGDMFFQHALLDSTLKSLKEYLNDTKNMSIISILGGPLLYKNKLFNCAFIIQKGKILGIVPKSYIPNYNEFYEKRWFFSGNNKQVEKINFLGEETPFGTNLLFQEEKNQNITFGVELCEDVWAIKTPSENHALNGATILFNLSASNELTTKNDYRKNLLSVISKKLMAAYIYASSGIFESTSDIVFGGSSYIFENGKLLKEGDRYSLTSNVITEDIDLESLIFERTKNTSFGLKENENVYQIIPFSLKPISSMERVFKEYPFVPTKKEVLKIRSEEILEIQANALARRLHDLKAKKCVIGISGGLDSTLAFLVSVRALEILGKPKENIIGITMPGFGTSSKTYENSLKLLKAYGATAKEISIKASSEIHLEDIGLSKDDRSTTYENAQARERTQILMDIANKESGIVIGTGDLSELALGWCTYNGDHMSMYSVNNSIPKTLVRSLVSFLCEKESGAKKEVLQSILDTPISPELLPPDENGTIQLTEKSVGPYVLHDYFLYHMLRHGRSPKTIYFLACKTFEKKYQKEEIMHWLKVFIKRFFQSQFKRNCVPDGPKVGSISLSPRGDARIPSDMNYEIWLEELEGILCE